MVITATNAQKATAALIDMSTEITRAQHPKLYESIEQLCLLNGIHRIPKLYHSEHMQGIAAAAISSRDALVLGKDTVENAGSMESLAVIAHEIGHLLHGHEGPSHKIIEHEADKAAIHLLGSRQPVKTLRHTASEQFEASRMSHHLPSNTWLQRGFKHFVARAENSKLKAGYGTASEIADNIARTTPEDRSHVDRLIAERNCSVGVIEKS